MLPAHLMGNMWQQDWSNLWDMLQPYQDAGEPRHHRQLHRSRRTITPRTREARRPARRPVEIDRAGALRRSPSA
jgi:hypothetical protein